MRVLVVDDNQMAIAVIRSALNHAGYEVLCAPDGPAALKILRDNPIRLVISDWRMPEMSGLELCHKVRAETRGGYVYFILLTACDELQHRVDGLAAGADDFIAKPFNPEELVARVRAGERILAADRAELQAEIALRRLAEKDLVEHRQNLERANRELESSNVKLSGLYQTAQRFVDNVSHEFRTPLTVIKGYAEAISEEMAGPINDQQKEFLGFVVDRTRELAQMVDDLLDSSKIRAGTLRIDRAPQRLADILAAVRPMLLAKAAGNHVRLDETLDPHPPVLFADAEKAGRVIVNLVVNAIKFSPENSTVNLWTRAHDDHVEIGVTDAGPGISAENLKLIFDRFQQFGQPQDTAKGFGLGLNIARELVALNLGDIRAQSTPGRGSTFSFTLPINDPAVIVRRYLNVLPPALDNEPDIAVLRVSHPSGASITSALRGFIASSIRPTDLVLSDPAGQFLLVIGVTADHELWTQRLHAALVSFAAQPSAAARPPASVENVGHWPRSAGRETLRSHILELLISEVTYA